MQLYFRAAYHAWCNGKGEQEITESADEFVKMMNRQFQYEEADIIDFLSKQNWFHGQLTKTKK